MNPIELVDAFLRSYWHQEHERTLAAAAEQISTAGQNAVRNVAAAAGNAMHELRQSTDAAASLARCSRRG